MNLNEADTRAKLIDPAIYRRGWTEDLIRREETAGAIEILGDQARRRARGKVDYVLRVKSPPPPTRSPSACSKPKRKTSRPPTAEKLFKRIRLWYKA